MKKILFMLMFMLLPIGAVAEDFIVTEAQYVVISGNTLDTLGRTMIEPDSIRIVVTDSSGTELFDAWFEPADAQCALNGDVITFFDQWEDINGAASVGTFSIMATIASDADNNIDVYSNQNYTLRGVATTTESMYADIVSILAEVVNIDGAVPFNWTSDDVAVVTLTNTVTGGATVAKQNIIIDTVNAIIDTLQLQDGWVAREASLFSGNLNLDNVTGSYDAADFEAASLNGKGDWNVGKTGYAITDAEKALIADSVWHANFELHDGTAGSFGDSAQGWGATAAGGTDTLNIKTMMERNFTSASGGDGWANMIADSVWLLDTTGNRIATGFGNILAAINDSMENLASISDIADSSYARKVVKRGIVKTLPDVSGFSSTVFTEADDYWIDNLIEMRDGAAVGQITRISDFTAATDAATFSPSFSVEPAIGDSFYVLAVFSESPSSGGFDTLSTVFVDRLTGRVADTTWLSSLAARDGTAGSFGDSAQGWGATSAGGTDTLNIKTMMERNFTSASGGDGWANMIADSSADQVWDELIADHQTVLTYGDTLIQTTTLIRDTVYATIDTLQRFTKPATDTLQGIIDTLQLQDGWVAKEATSVLIRDTVYATIDTLQRFTKPATDTLQGIIDTLQLQDNWVAREASLFDVTSDSVIVDFSIWNTKDPEVTVVTNNDKTGYALSIAGIDAISRYNIE